MRIAYFTNQYPAVSHTFIRREIRALEAAGVTVVRYAIRSSSAGPVDAEDQSELERTHYILGATVYSILRTVLSSMVRRPLVTTRMLCTALRLGRHSDRGLLRHLAYAIEAIVLADWFSRDKVQHIHAHFGTNPAAIAMLAGQLSGLSYSFTAHGSEEFEKAALLSLDEKLRHASFAICVSSFGRSQLMRWSPPDLWGKIAVVHCGLDSTYLDSNPPPLPPDARLVCVGRIGEHKAQLVLVEAVRRLRDAGKKCEVVLVGDGPMRPQVQAAIVRYELTDRINITGWVSSERVKAEIEAARVLVLPSFSENMPVVIMEAMALGRPVISTYVAGIPELVRPGETGWLVPASDAEALTDAIDEALTAPLERLAKMGTAARAIVRENHDATKQAKKLKILFANVIGS